MSTLYLINTVEIIDDKKVKNGYTTNDYQLETFGLNTKVTVTAPGGKIVASKQAGDNKLTEHIQ